MKALPLLLLIAGCGGAASARERADTAAVQPRPSDPATVQEVHIHLDVRGRLAAYQLVIRWDRTVARIASIERCTSKEFPATPQFNAAHFATGSIRVLGDMATARGAGEYHLLTVRFERLTKGTTDVEVTVEALYDDGSVPQRVAGELTVSPTSLRFD